MPMMPPPGYQRYLAALRAREAQWLRKLPFAIAKLALYAAAIFLLICLGLAALSVRKAAIGFQKNDDVITAKAVDVADKASTQIDAVGSEAHRVLLEAGLTTMETRKAAATQRAFWDHEVPRLATRAEGTFDRSDALLSSLTDTSNGLNQDGKDITAAVTDTSASLKPALNQATITFAAAGTTLQKAGDVIGDPNIPITFKYIGTAAGHISDTTDKLDHIAGNIDHKVNDIVHPGFWGKVQGYTLFGADIFKDIVETHYYLTTTPLNITTTSLSKAVQAHKGAKPQETSKP